jgi:hypothetical protein
MGNNTAGRPILAASLLLRLGWGRKPSNPLTL